MASGLHPAHQNNLSRPILALEVTRSGTILGMRQINCSRQTALGISSSKAATPTSCNSSCVHHRTKRQVLCITENTSYSHESTYAGCPHDNVSCKLLRYMPVTYHPSMEGPVKKRNVHLRGDRVFDP